jgi:hypothetical protein
MTFSQLHMQSLAIVDDQIGNGLGAVHLASGLSWPQPSPTPRTRAGSSEAFDALAKRLWFSGSDLVLTHDVFARSVRHVSAAGLLLLCELMDALM